MGQLYRVAKGKFLEVIGKGIGLRHGGSLYKHRDNGNVTLQRGSGFEPDEIVGVIEPAMALMIGGVKPSFSYQGKQNSAGRYVLIDDLAEIAPRLNIFNVHEYRGLAELSYQIVEQAASLAFGISSTITDEDRSHISPPPYKNVALSKITSPRTPLR
jgi:hypothetical protein